jgi:hypothetical protein
MSFVVQVASIIAFAGIGVFHGSFDGKIPHPPTEGDACEPASPSGTLASGNEVIGASARASVIAPPPDEPPLPDPALLLPPVLLEPPALLDPPVLLAPPALLAPPVLLSPPALLEPEVPFAPDAPFEVPLLPAPPPGPVLSSEPQATAIDVPKINGTTKACDLAIGIDLLPARCPPQRLSGINRIAQNAW